MEFVLAALILGGFLLAAGYFWYRAQRLKASAAQLEQELGVPQNMPTPLRPPAPEDQEMMDASDMLDDFDDATRVASVSPEDLMAATKK